MTTTYLQEIYDQQMVLKQKAETEIPFVDVQIKSIESQHRDLIDQARPILANLKGLNNHLKNLRHKAGKTALTFQCAQCNTQVSIPHTDLLKTNTEDEIIKLETRIRTFRCYGCAYQEIQSLIRKRDRDLDELKFKETVAKRNYIESQLKSILKRDDGGSYIIAESGEKIYLSNIASITKVEKP